MTSFLLDLSIINLLALFSRKFIPCDFKGSCNLQLTKINNKTISVILDFIL